MASTFAPAPLRRVVPPRAVFAVLVATLAVIAAIVAIVLSASTPGFGARVLPIIGALGLVQCGVALLALLVMVREQFQRPVLPARFR